jgi:hypothetical protein
MKWKRKREDQDSRLRALRVLPPPPVFHDARALADRLREKYPPGRF